jgi:endoglucanase
LHNARVRDLVTVGDFITMDRAVIPLQNNFIAGKAFDDRCCLVALLETLRRMRSIPHAWDIYAVANVNEEDSAVYVGALTSAYSVQPQIAITLDVTHAHQPGLHDDAAPYVNRGPCIARGANVHPAVFESLRTAAVREAVPHQITVYGDDTQTNAWMIQVAGEGVPTGLVEIPLRYMHTPVETIHLDDIEHTAELLSTWAASLTSDFAQALQGEHFIRDSNSHRKPTPRRPKFTAGKTTRPRSQPKSRPARSRRKR